jgi:hypothetical protein
MNTTYFLNQVMGNVFKTKTNPALPAQYWIGLSRTAPNIAGSGVTEPSTTGTGYARIQLTNLSAPEDGEITNTGAVAFDESLTAWGTVTHYVIYDTVTGGNLLMYGLLTISRSVEQNTVITIKAGELQLILENPAA